MRYPFVAILVVAVGAMVGGAGSFAAIGEWVADLSADVRAGLGLVGWIPGPVTVWRVLTVVDRAGLEAAIGAWVRAWVKAADAALSRSRQRRARVRRVIAVDGKAMRASCHGQAGVHLLGAFDHARGVVLAQVDVDAKTTEISVVLNVSGPDRGLDRRRRHRGCDARADRARQLPAGPVEGAALKGHPVRHTATGRGHGRIEKRTRKAVTVPAGLGFPHTAQTIQVTRTSHPINKRGKGQRQAPPPAAGDRLRDRDPARRAGRPCRAGRLAPQTVVDREPAALGPRRHVR